MFLKGNFTKLCSLQFLNLESYLPFSGIKIVSIQRDVNNPTQALIADQISISNVDFQTNYQNILYGSRGLPSINVDGPKEAARFLDIVEILQPDETSITETITGDCNESGLKAGSLSEARFTNIVSAVLISEAKIAILEIEENFLYIINIKTGRVGKLASYEKPTAICKEPSTGMFLLFTDNGIQRMSLLNPSLTAGAISRTGLAYTNDGLLRTSTFTLKTM